MMLDVNFDEIDLFLARFGSYRELPGGFSIEVIDGAGIPDSLEDNFKYRYIYDPSKDIKYEYWFMEGGVLFLKENKDDKEWVKVSKKELIEELFRYQYCGRFDLVFKNVYRVDLRLSLYDETGKNISGEVISKKIIKNKNKNKNKTYREFIVEGVLINSHEHGWARFDVDADGFFIHLKNYV